MALLDGELQLADVLLRLSNAVNGSTHFNSEPVVANVLSEFQSQCIAVASRLPHEDEKGLCSKAFKAMFGVASKVAKALTTVDPSNVEKEEEENMLTFAIVDFLRTCSRGTAEARIAKRMTAIGCGQDPCTGLGVENRLQSYMMTEDYVKFSEAYAHADATDAMLTAGANECATMSEKFSEATAATIRRMTIAMNMAVMPIMFDGMRLRAGLQMSVRYAHEKVNKGTFMSDCVALKILSGGDAQIDCARARWTAAFLIAAARSGCVKYGADPAPIDTLEESLSEKLQECRRVSEAKTPVPSKAMRLVISDVAQFAEAVATCGVAEEEALCLRLALAVPCVLPHKELILDHQDAKTYEGGMLSIWDAVGLLSRTRRYLDMPACATHLLLASVMAGVVMSLVVNKDNVGECGPFRVASSFRTEVRAVERKWPELSLPESSVEGRQGKRGLTDLSTAEREGKGKMVSANASICAAIETSCFKRSKERTNAGEVRYSSALTMMAISEAFATELDNCSLEDYECRPTDGIAPLKRIYVAEMSCQPSVVDFLRQNPALGNPLYEANINRRGQSAIEDGDALESPWRELVGGAVILHSMYPITTAAFQKTLMEDWKPIPMVQQALMMRKSASRPEGVRVGGVMTPGVAMRLLTKRAVDISNEVFDESVINEYKIDSENKRRIMRQHKKLAESAYFHTRYAPVWECMIQHLISMNTSARVTKSKRQKK